jgi:hypothetical protein
MGKQENFADLLTSQLEQIDLPLHYDFILPPLPLFLCVSKGVLPWLLIFSR